MLTVQLCATSLNQFCAAVFCSKVASLSQLKSAPGSSSSRFFGGLVSDFSLDFMFEVQTSTITPVIPCSSKIFVKIILFWDAKFVLRCIVL